MELWQGIILGILTFGGTVYASYRTNKAAVRVKELDVDGQAFQRAEGIYTGAIAALQQQVTDLDTARKNDKLEYATELAKRDQKIQRIEEDVRHVRDRNNALVTFVYKTLAILRQHQLIDQINPADVPADIHI